MRYPIKLAILAAAALAASGCKRQPPVVNVTNEVVQDENLTAPAPDATATESVSNAPEPMPPAPAPSTNEATTGHTSGGDTGGNNVESNVAGM